ncbi:hypothetical protein BGZ54_006232 [Gamsiella multidivaricata]|nr:hypothetical protein BGZ54_006232 [Gamsiella multidivaricata]
MSSGCTSDDDFVDSSEYEHYGSQDESSVTDFDQVDEFEFADMMAEKYRKKSYEIEFSVLFQEDITAAQVNASSHVAGMLGVSDNQAVVLLRTYKWNIERLIEQYMENPEKTFDQAGVVVDAAQAPVMDRPSEFECLICYDNSPGGDALGLQCGHIFCQACYEQYLTQKIVDEGECRRIRCPESGCAVLLDEHTIGKIVSVPVMEKYRVLQDREYVAEMDSLRWCPGPDCENAVECQLPHSSFTTIVPAVKCACGYKFCFGCGQNDHQPAPCRLAKLWQKKCADDSETTHWILTYTKECGKCQSTIEKNGGCNHMTCRKCQYEFCWVCMGPWEEHGSNWYTCNRFEEVESAEARDQQNKSRATLERYLHYYNRFANHEQSAKLDQELYNRAEKNMEEIQLTSALSWIEAQFLQKAVDTLTSSRMVLRWSYAFAYYLVKSNMTELFEDNQRDLEMAVEALSELLEKPIEKETIAELRQQIIDKTVYVSSRREVVLEDTTKGLADGLWEYHIDSDKAEVPAQEPEVEPATAQAEQVEQVEQVEQAEQAEQVEQAEQEGQNDQPERVARVATIVLDMTNDQPMHPGVEQVVEDEQVVQVEQVIQVERVVQVEQAVQVEQVEQPEQAEQVEQPEQVEQVEQVEQ